MLEQNPNPFAGFNEEERTRFITLMYHEQRKSQTFTSLQAELRTSQSNQYNQFKSQVLSIPNADDLITAEYEKLQKATHEDAGKKKKRKSCTII